MATAPGDFITLDLGPRLADGGAFVVLNLGVDWNENPPEPPEPVIRGLRSAVALVWQQGVRVGKGTRIGWGRSEAVVAYASVGWDAAHQRRASVSMTWGRRRF